MKKSVEIIFDGEELEVVGFYTPKEDSNYIDPPFPEYFEIEKILFKGVDVIDLINDTDIKKIETLCLEKL
jgi:hypothetical protein